MKQTIILGLSLCSFLPSLLHADTKTYKHEEPAYDLVEYKAPKKVAKLPKNIVFMIGDGMGLHQVFATSRANNGKLNMLQAPVVGLAKTPCSNKLITDSAAAGTALACGEKTTYGTVGMNPEGKVLKSLADIAKEHQKSCGVVVTCNLTHATPGSFIGHDKSRGNTEAIALGALDGHVDFFAGGGLNDFEKRKDGKNLLEEMTKKGYTVYKDEENFLKGNKMKTLAVLADDHLPDMPKRGDFLPKAVGKALECLSQNDKGFFLMVEGSQIDFKGHDNNLEGVVRETIDFDKAVGVVLKWMEKHPDTLLVITADHETGGAMIVGGEKDSAKVDVHYCTGGHSGIAVPVYVFGSGSENFSGVYENSDLSNKIKALIQAKK